MRRRDVAAVTTDVSKDRDDFILKCHLHLNDFLTPKKEALHCVEHRELVQNHHYALSNFPEVLRCHIHRDGSLK